jgi:hypothetical protein
MPLPGAGALAGSAHPPGNREIGASAGVCEPLGATGHADVRACGR